MDELNKIMKFLKYDSDIKNILINSAPNNNLEINAATVANYSNYLFNALKNIEFDLKRMIELYPCFGDGEKYINNLFNAFYDRLSNCTSYEKLKNFYTVCMSSLSEEVIDEVGKNCIGYYLFRGVPLQIGSSINELLHIIHQTVINNENLYLKMPKLNTKIYDEDDNSINLYGNDTEIGKNIFDVISSGLDLDPTDILALNEENVLIMVRDRGHALTIEIEKENDKYYVKYFIPKICNVDMVNNLKGVRKVNYDSKYTNGIFEVSNNVANEIANFISKVPTDSDMRKKGGILYNFYQSNEFFENDVIHEEDNEVNFYGKR